MEECPTCRAKFSKTRNINLENIHQWSNFICANGALGCPVMCPKELMADHLACCIYRKATCPLNKVVSIVCPWEGLQKDVLSHCRLSHQKHLVEGGIFMSPSTDDVANIVLHDDEIFIFQKRFRNGKLYCAAEKVGMSQKLYTASFILNTVDGSERISFTHIVRDVSSNFRSLIKSGKILKLTDKLVKRFIFDGKLALQVLILRGNAKRHLL
jgi:hypothetical protein